MMNPNMMYSQMDDAEVGKYVKMQQYMSTLNAGGSMMQPSMPQQIDAAGGSVRLAACIASALRKCSKVGYFLRNDFVPVVLVFLHFTHLLVTVQK